MIKLAVDTTIFSDAEISKAVYLESAASRITRNRVASEEIITISPLSSSEDESLVEARFLRYLHDAHLRQIIEAETHDVRTILYIKAFANHDELINLPD